MRGAYQAMAAKGLMTLDEPEASLDGLEATRGTALRELEAARGRLEGAEELERDRDALLEAQAGAPPRSLEASPRKDAARSTGRCGSRFG
jgi:hypothetical protein